MHAPPICRQELLLVGAAHELRTPLTVARGHLELLRRNGDSPMLEVALDELDRLGRIVARMLLIAELETERPAFERVELASLLVEAAAARPGVALSAAPQGAVAGDGALLLLALDELLANSLARSPLGEPVVLDGGATEGGVEIGVTDRGRGVGDGSGDGLFDCFARIERQRGRSTGGAGLGLAIVRAVAHAHRGRCGVREHGPQPGATWWLWLPAFTGDA